MAMESFTSNPKPSQIPTTTTKKPRPKTKEVSSRYLSTPSTSTTITRCPPMTTSPMFHPANNSSSTTVPRPDRYPDENALSETLARRKMRLFSSDNAAQTPHRSTDRRIDALGLFRENPPRANDDTGLSAAATRSVDWGRERKEGPDAPSLCRTSMRSDAQRHSFDSNKEGGSGGGRTFAPLKAAAAAAQKPPNGKPGAEARRERKGLRREEEVHTVRMLECRYLQWRFANARARAVDCARTKAAEKIVCNVSCKLQELRDSVMKKRMELEQLKRLESLHTIIEAQMPYLDDWTCIEGEYSSSLSGATEALHNASSQIPITGTVKADIGDLRDVMDSAANMLDVVSPCVDKFLTKAEGIENLTSELAKVVSVEKSMIEECGNLLALAHDFQLKECSLRSQLIQAKQQQSSEK